jgi:hypothetical protein
VVSGQKISEVSKYFGQIGREIIRSQKSGRLWTGFDTRGKKKKERKESF